MRYTMTLDIEFGSGEEARTMYSSLIGLARGQLGNARDGFSFSGTCEPSLFTLMRPATVTIKPAREQDRFSNDPIVMDAAKLDLSDELHWLLNERQEVLGLPHSLTLLDARIAELRGQILGQAQR